MKILISDKFSPRGVEAFKGVKGLTVHYKPDTTAAELLKIIGDYDGLAVRSKTKVTPQALKAAKKLKVIGRAGIGVDNIDQQAATRQGVVVMNTPGGNTITTAEHTISMMMALSRNIPQATASLKSGKWEKSKFMGREVFNKKLGIIGMGNIGRIVADRAKGLKMRVIAFDPFLTDELAAKAGVEKVDLETLVAEADFITVHTPKTPDTTNLLNAAMFKKMKKTARVLNCARGGIVNENDLYDALVKGRIAGAALDVFEIEPAKDNKLFTLDNVICTPHLGASTAEAQDNVGLALARQMIDYLTKKIISNALNVPTVDPEMMAALEPYLKLAGKLGRFLSQRLSWAPSQVEIEYAGELHDYDLAPVTNAVLLGFMENFDDNVNPVNAAMLARERGLRIVESTTKRPRDYTNLITITVKNGNKSSSVSGVKFGQDHLRIVGIDNYKLEASPEGPLLLVRNKDVPGVVGMVGALLGRNKINIAQLQLGRSQAGATAMLVVNLDSPISNKLIASLKKNPNILEVSQVIL